MDLIREVNNSKKLGGYGALGELNKEGHPLFDNYLALYLSIRGMEVKEGQVIPRGTIVEDGIAYPSTQMICNQFKLYDDEEAI